MLFDAIDWERWEPRERATLLFVLDGDRVLLIRKLRGLGQGKINAPGGRIEPGETAAQGAIRELREEVCVEVDQVEARGELRFQFVDGYSLHATVFTATAFRGEPTATEEAIPFWFERGALPFDEMWADDRLWLPELLAGRSFSGAFLFDGETMLGHRLDVLTD